MCFCFIYAIQLQWFLLYDMQKLQKGLNLSTRAELENKLIEYSAKSHYAEI